MGAAQRPRLSGLAWSPGSRSVTVCAKSTGCAAGPVFSLLWFAPLPATHAVVGLAQVGAVPTRKAVQSVRALFCGQCGAHMGDAHGRLAARRPRVEGSVQKMWTPSCLPSAADQAVQANSRRRLAACCATAENRVLRVAQETFFWVPGAPHDEEAFFYLPFEKGAARRCFWQQETSCSWQLGVEAVLVS